MGQHIRIVQLAPRIGSVDGVIWLSSVFKGIKMDLRSDIVIFMSIICALEMTV